MSGYKKLRRFSTEELVFDEEETRIILKFIFGQKDYDLIETLTISDTVREFAQGLLVEAVDASYAVGFVEGIFRSATNPTKGAIKILKSLGRRSAKHWFKHASFHDLKDIKIYEFVRIHIANQFRKPLQIMALASLPVDRLGAFLAYRKPPYKFLKVWG